MWNALTPVELQPIRNNLFTALICKREGGEKRVFQQNTLNIFTDRRETVIGQYDLTTLDSPSAKYELQNSSFSTFTSNMAQNKKSIMKISLRW